MSGPAEASSIATARLVLQPLRVEDADEMVVVLADPALHEFIGGEPATLEELRERYASWTRGSGSAHEMWLNWIVRLQSDDAPIGAVQATVVTAEGSATASVAWTIGSSWQRQGYAAEAASGLVHWLAVNGVESIVANVHPGHDASAAVAARAGLRRTDEIVDGEVVWRIDSISTDQH
jgi:RimJ/RimL family protein N-acetyltransferase